MNDELIKLRAEYEELQKQNQALTEENTRLVGIIEECHRQNPLPKFVDVPEGTL